jgi:hypothetical protein
METFGYKFGICFFLLFFSSSLLLFLLYVLKKINQIYLGEKKKKSNQLDRRLPNLPFNNKSHFRSAPHKKKKKRKR